jgi:hypothetical protein
MAKASSFRSPASLTHWHKTHWHNKAQRVWQPYEAMRSVEAGCRFFQRADDHHGRVHRVGAFECALQRVGKQDRAKALALLVLGDRQPPAEPDFPPKIEHYANWEGQMIEGSRRLAARNSLGGMTK